MNEPIHVFQRLTIKTSDASSSRKKELENLIPGLFGTIAV